MADYPITLSTTRRSVLTDVERINGFSHKFTIPYSDVAVSTATTSADTVTVTLGSTPALWLIDKACVNITTAFAGTTAMTINVGTTSATSTFITAISVLTAGLLQPTTGINTTATISTSTATASKSLVAIFSNTTGGSPSALTAGSLDIYLSINDMTAGNIG